MNIEQWFETLFIVASSGKWTTKHEEEYNQLDHELTQAKLLAGNKCCKLPAGNTLWTPVLTQAIKRVQCWKGIEKWAQGGHISTTVLKCQALKGQEQFSTDHWKMPQHDIWHKVAGAYVDYYQCKKTIGIHGLDSL